MDAEEDRVTLQVIVPHLGVSLSWFVPGSSSVGEILDLLPIALPVESNELVVQDVTGASLPLSTTVNSLVPSANSSVL